MKKTANIRPPGETGLRIKEQGEKKYRRRLYKIRNPDAGHERGGAVPGAGRKEIPDQRIYGIRVFSERTGYSLALIKAVRETSAGAEAFKENDIWLLKFVRAANLLLNTANELPKGFATWKEFREMNEARISEVNRKKAQGLLMATADGKRQAGDAMAMTFSELDRRDRELPPALAGRNAVEISERMISDTKSIKKNLAVKFQEIGK